MKERLILFHKVSPSTSQQKKQKNLSHCCKRVSQGSGTRIIHKEVVMAGVFDEDEGFIATLSELMEEDRKRR